MDPKRHFVTLILSQLTQRVGPGQTCAYNCDVYIMASIGFMAGNIFYDSLLPIVAERNKLDYVSSFGYGLGYLGGGLLFLINVLMYLNPNWFGIPDATTAVRISFVSVALWWAVFTIPILLFVSEDKTGSNVSINRAIANGLKQIRSTFSHIRNMKIIGKYRRIIRNI